MFKYSWPAKDASYWENQSLSNAFIFEEISRKRRTKIEESANELLFWLSSCTSGKPVAPEWTIHQDGAAEKHV